MPLDKKKTALILLLGAVFLFSIDRYLKSLILEMDEKYSLIGDFLSFSLAKNYYIAFSLPFGGKILIGVIIAIIIGMIFYSLKLAKKNEWLEVSVLTIIVFGAISNLLDRLQLGYVIDYLDLKYFTVFNVADMMIVGGVCILALISYIGNKNHYE